MSYQTFRMLSPTLFLLVLLWLLLSQGDLASWAIGVPFMLIALILTRQLKKSTSTPHKVKLSPVGLVVFVFYFIAESIRGAWQVSRLVLFQRLRLNSIFHRYQMRLQNDAARKFFIGSISLLPGTLSADSDKDTICIHILDRNNNVVNDIKRLEAKVAALFGEQYDS